jgi:hypothetical protein
MDKKFSDAVIDGNLDLVKKYVESGYDYYPYIINECLLRIVIDERRMDIIQYLVNLGADPLAYYGHSMSWCIEHDALTLFTYLLASLTKRKRFVYIQSQMEFEKILEEVMNDDGIGSSHASEERLSIPQSHEKKCLSTLRPKIILDNILKKNIFIKKILSPTSLHIQLIFI